MTNELLRVFYVKTDRIADFLGILDPRESARVTYRGFPHDDYIVVLENGTKTWNDPDLDQTGITPVPQPMGEGAFVAALSVMPVVVIG